MFLLPLHVVAIFHERIRVDWKKLHQISCVISF